MPLNLLDLPIDVLKDILSQVNSKSHVAAVLF